jgi:hypothetical protein
MESLYAFKCKRFLIFATQKHLEYHCNALFETPCIIRNIKSRRIRWAGNVARIRYKRNACRIVGRKSERKSLYEEKDVGW